MPKTIEVELLAKGTTAAGGGIAALEPELIAAIIPWHATPLWEGIIAALGGLVLALSAISIAQSVLYKRRSHKKESTNAGR